MREYLKLRPGILRRRFRLLCEDRRNLHPVAGVPDTYHDGGTRRRETRGPFLPVLAPPLYRFLVEERDGCFGEGVLLRVLFVEGHSFNVQSLRTLFLPLGFCG